MYPEHVGTMMDKQYGDRHKGKANRHNYRLRCQNA